MRYKQAFLRAPLVGGSWNNGSNAGLAALNLNNAPSNRNSNIGFRSALEEKGQKVCRHADVSSAESNGSHILSNVLKYGWAYFVSNINESKVGRYA